MSTTPTTAPSANPIYSGPRPNTLRMSDEQLKLLKMKLVGLRRLHDATGFSTNKQIIDMLSRVHPSDLIVLGLMFEPVEGGNR
jgi:hypothetical protein